MVNDQICLVCGYEMDEGPRDYNICPSCGTEFGLHDVNSTIVNLRRAWITRGKTWHSKVVPKPDQWNPSRQLQELLLSGSVVPAGSVGYSLQNFTEFRIGRSHRSTRRPSRSISMGRLEDLLPKRISHA